LLQHFFDYFNPLDPLFMRSPVIDSKIEDYLSIAASNGDDIKREENIKRAIDNYMLKIISSDYVIKITANFMRKWLNKYGFESIVEYIDIQYLSAQCDAGEDFNLQERLQEYKRLAPGNIAPDITWLGADNNIYTLSNLKANKKVVIFWGTWCPNCEELLPKIYNYLQNKNNIKVIAIGLDEDEKQWEITIQKFVGWQHLRAPEKWQNDIVKLYGVVATPSIFIINSDNKIQKKVNNINDFINEIEKK